MSNEMQAVTRTEYGGPEVLDWSTAPVPIPTEGRVLVRVEAASPNAADWHMLRGLPYLLRPSVGWLRPRHQTFGTDVAGVVEAVGPGVDRLEVGDRVVGNTGGSGFAEYALLSAGSAGRLPAHVSFEEAATLPIAGVTALQAVREQGQVAPGDRVLVNGASGGVGHFAVQIATLLGAEVTAVASRRNHDLVRRLGAQDAIDYATADYPDTGRRWDVIVDVAGTQPAAANARALTEDGRWVMVGGVTDNRVTGPLGPSLRGLASFARRPQRASMFIAQETAARIDALVAWLGAGDLTPHVERAFPMSAAAEAMAHQGTARTRGKLLLEGV